MTSENIFTVFKNMIFVVFNCCHITAVQLRSLCAARPLTSPFYIRPLVQEMGRYPDFAAPLSSAVPPVLNKESGNNYNIKNMTGNFKSEKMLML